MYNCACVILAKMRGERRISVKYVCLFVAVAFAFKSVGQDSLNFLPQPTLKPYALDLLQLVPDDGEIRAGLLYDVKRDRIVWEKNMDDAWPIASLTKMMVGLLAVEDVEAGRVNMS